MFGLKWMCTDYVFGNEERLVRWIENCLFRKAFNGYHRSTMFNEVGLERKSFRNFKDYKRYDIRKK